MAFEVSGGTADRSFEDVEDAILYAQRSARKMRERRLIRHASPAWVDRAGRLPVHHKRTEREVATVFPSGQVDFTFYGGSIASCRPEKKVA